MGNKKHSTDVDNKDPRPVVETYTAEIIVDISRYKEKGLLKGTTVEVRVLERNLQHIVTARDGASVLIRPHHVKRYEFDDVPDMSADDWDEVFDA